MVSVSFPVDPVVVDSVPGVSLLPLHGRTVRRRAPMDYAVFGTKGRSSAMCACVPASSDFPAFLCDLLSLEAVLHFESLRPVAYAALASSSDLIFIRRFTLMTTYRVNRALAVWGRKYSQVGRFFL